MVGPVFRIYCFYETGFIDGFAILAGVVARLEWAKGRGNRKKNVKAIQFKGIFAFV
jgi:hypothetical protein